MELRTEVAAIIRREIGDLLNEPRLTAQSEELADAILALPEIKEALEIARREQEILSPEQIRKIGMVYGEEREIRVTDD